MRPSSRSLIALVAALGTVIALGACGGGGSGGGGGGSSAKQVKIGAINALTGSGASAGLDTIRGAELAAQIINGKYPNIDLPFAKTSGLPKLGGAKIKLIKKDTEGSPETGASDVNELVTTDNVAGIVGEYSSSVTKVASARAERLGVPFVNGASSAPELTQRGLKWFFRVGPTDETFGEGMFGLLKQQQAKGHQIKKVAILHTNDTYGNGVDKVTKQLAKKHGLQVVADVAYDANTTDLTSAILKIRQAKPDVLFDSSYTPDAILLIKGLKHFNYYPGAVLAYGAGFSDPTFLPTLDGAAAGMMSRAAWSLQISDPASKAIAKLFKKKYNRPMTENSARNFTALVTLATAINNAGGTDPKKVRQALENVDIPKSDLIMPWGGVKFDSDHQNSEARGIVQQVQKGHYRVVYPKDAAVSKVVWPLQKAQ